MPKIVLASQSPRRRELIKLISNDVLCVSSGADEIVPDDLPVEKVPQCLALCKARAVASQFPHDLVIGSDTLVVLDGEVLAKPRDEAEAFSMLRRLSGETHSVITGCALVLGKSCEVFSQVTEVEFYELSDEEILSYIDSGEPMDKAGSYGIQGRGSLFVKSIQGDYFSVVGLPVAKLKRRLDSFILREAGDI